MSVSDWVSDSVSDWVSVASDALACVWEIVPPLLPSTPDQSPFHRPGLLGDGLSAMSVVRG